MTLRQCMWYTVIMKKCIHCQIEKELEHFRKSKKHKSGITNTCIDCLNIVSQKFYKANKSKFTERKRKYRKERKDFINSCKDVPCMDCGIKYPYYVMDFDHRNPDEKLFLISQAGYGNSHNGNVRKTLGSGGVSKENLLREIAKCDVVCSNCHRERTHKRREEKREKIIC